jgi:non-specific serine/threonine protein kinase
VGLLQLGDIEYLQGNYQQAGEVYQQSLSISLQTGNNLGCDRRRVRIAQVALATGDTRRAQSLLGEIFLANDGTGDRWLLARALVTAASLSYRRDQLEQAACLLGAAQVFLETFGTSLWPVDRQLYESHARLLQDRLGATAFAKATASGRLAGANQPQALTLLQAALTEEPVTAAPKRQKQAPGGLTAREREVAALIAQGRNNTEIAQALFVGIRTVETHITHILTKLNYTSRTQIAVWAARQD